MSNPAESYERSIVPYLFQPWAARLLERAEPQPGERLLDVACGTGIVARQAARYVGPDGQVAGVDLSPAMLDVARRAAASEGVEAEWHEADVRTLPFADQAFDVVLCQQGLQFVPERDQAVKEIYRVLTPGGRAVISVWRDIALHPFFGALHEVIQRRIGVGAAAAPFAFGNVEELREVLERSGFAEVEIDQPSMTARYPEPERNLRETVHALVAVSPALQEVDEAERAKMTEEIIAEMRETHSRFVESDHVSLQWHANVALARRAA